MMKQRSHAGSSRKTIQLQVHLIIEFLKSSRFQMAQQESSMSHVEPAHIRREQNKKTRKKKLFIPG